MKKCLSGIAELSDGISAVQCSLDSISVSVNAPMVTIRHTDRRWIYFAILVAQIT